jgi:glycosyltransferase involved in cell wall biosynthesis
MESNKCIVSVLMTSFNRANFIASAIESVLASSYTNFEFIICDDCSTDGTYEIEIEYAKKDNRIKLFRNETNLGDFPNRDKAASHATGIYLKYVDSDDIIYPHGLATMVAAMLAFPDAVLGLSQIANDINEVANEPILISSERAYLEHFYGYGTLRYGPTGAIIKKEILLKMGGFGMNRFVGDTELWLKIVATNALVKMAPNLVEWRRHDGQEFHFGMEHDIYIQKAYPAYMLSLQTDTCPLQKEDIIKITKRLQWKHARDILSIAFKKGKFKMAWHIYKEANFNCLQLAKGIWPYNIMKKYFHKNI